MDNVVVIRLIAALLFVVVLVALVQRRRKRVGAIAPELTQARRIVSPFHGDLLASLCAPAPTRGSLKRRNADSTNFRAACSRE